MPILIPCHRVLAQNGLGGYSGGRPGEGLETKRWLLTMEGVLPPPLDWIEPIDATFAQMDEAAKPGCRGTRANGS